MDGAEQDVLAGATETLHFIQSLMIEVEESHGPFESIKRTLEDSGLAVVSSHRTDAAGRYVNYRPDRVSKCVNVGERS